jgi:CubicO group peptidase (beta-lactamase class C family)
MIYILLLIALLCPAVAADKASAVDLLITRYQQCGLFNGTALIAEHGQVVLKKGYGMANMERGIPNTPDTRFRLGSLTKQFTAALIMQLVDEGKLDVNAPISRYLPDYPKTSGDKVTIHQLLNHTSGIPDFTGLPEYGQWQHESSKATGLIDSFSKLDLQFEPGTKFSYTNSGYFLLEVILRKVTGRPYGLLLRERIFDPAGMRDSGSGSTVSILSKRASGYNSSLDGYVNTSFLDASQPYAIYSTAEDLLRWDQALYTNKVLSASAKQRMFTPGLAGYGYGLFIRRSAVTTVEHHGIVNGFSTFFTRDLEPQRLIVLLNNTGAAPLAAMATAIRLVLEGHEPVFPRAPASPILYKTYQSSGLAATMEQIRRLRSTDGERYDISEGELARLAGFLLTRGKVKDALELAKFNAQESPKSATAATLLGRAYRAAGYRLEAIQAYTRAIELSETPRTIPGLTDAITQLQKAPK